MASKMRIWEESLQKQNIQSAHNIHGECVLARILWWILYLILPLVLSSLCISVSVQGEQEGEVALGQILSHVGSCWSYFVVAHIQFGVHSFRSILPSFITQAKLKHSKSNIFCAFYILHTCISTFYFWSNQIKKTKGWQKFGATQEQTPSSWAS